MQLRRSFSILAPLAVFLAASALQSAPLDAQQTVNLRTAPLPRRAIAIAESCLVVGDGTKGRPDGLLSVRSAAPTMDGSILIMNAGTSELLLFDRGGRFVQASSRPGEGPGELSGARAPGRVLSMVKYRDDSIAVFDGPQQRISVFDSRGRFGRAILVDTQPPAIPRANGPVPSSRKDFTSMAFIVGSTAEGDFLLVRDMLRTPTLTDAGVPPVGLQVFRDSLAFVRVSATGTVLWISRFLENTQHEWLIEAASRVPTATGARYSLAGGDANTLPTERFGSAAVAGGLAYHYSEVANELHAYNRLGQMTQRVLLPPVPIPTPPARGERLQKQGGLSMLSDTLGRVWIEVPRVRGGTAHDWWIVSGTGEIVATATTPARTAPLWIGATTIILRIADTDGVETVRVCGLRE